MRNQVEKADVKELSENSFSVRFEDGLGCGTNTRSEQYFFGFGGVYRFRPPTVLLLVH